MKNIVFIYAAFDSDYPFKKAFSSESAFERVLVWTKEIPQECVVVLTNSRFEKIVRNSLSVCGIQNNMVFVENNVSVLTLLEHMDNSSRFFDAKNIIYVRGDCPFLDYGLTREVYECHTKYAAEYTFADGYPYGFAPEILHSGTAKILYGKSEEFADVPVTSDSLFNVLKKNINDYEIETVIAPEDYRILRLDFSCSSNLTFLACKNLYSLALDKKIPFAARNLSDFAKNEPSVLRTVPAYYSIQICSKNSSEPVYSPFNSEEKNLMTLEQFKALLSDIHEFSDSCVIDLSAFGDPFNHPELVKFVEAVLSYETFQLVLETDGMNVSEEVVAELKAVIAAAPERMNKSQYISSAVSFIVRLDAMSENRYAAIHKSGSFEKAKKSLELLCSNFEGNVYPQFVRMIDNEDELELFYRFYSAKDSVSKGNVLIQKYNSYCGVLPARKVADLSPVKREACWHLKRDMTILYNGDVLFCNCCGVDSKFVKGNVFDGGVSSVWNASFDDFCSHLKESYPILCGKCDEYYTFNF